MLTRSLAVLVCAAMLTIAGAAAPSSAFAKSFILYSGSYTAGSSKGIYAWRFESKDGALSPIGLVAETPQPAHIWIAPNNKTLYAVNWEREGGVSAFRIDPKTAKLTFLNRVFAHGTSPNQVVLDPSGKIAVTVNYVTGNLAAFRVLPDGSLSGAFFLEQHIGTPLPGGQPGPRAHGIEFTKDGRTMFVAELGLDRVYTYRVDAKAAVITPAEPAYVSTHGGAGPRRLQLSPDERFLYVNHEMDSEVSVFTVNDGKLSEIQKLSTLPAGSTVKNTTSEIMIDRAGRHLYVANRGDDSVAVYTIDKATGRLTHDANVPSGGKTPRNLRIDPTGGYLLASNENGGSIVVLKIDKATGALTPTASAAQIDTPGGMYFLNAR